MTHVLLPLILVLADPVPEDDDVVAGGWGAVMFVFLIVAGIVLFWSLSKQLRKAQKADEAGVFDPPARRHPRVDDHRLASEDGDDA